MFYRRSKNHVLWITTSDSERSQEAAEECRSPPILEACWALAQKRSTHSLCVGLCRQIFDKSGFNPLGCLTVRLGYVILKVLHADSPQSAVILT
jgi:hypothetical protein